MNNPVLRFINFLRPHRGAVSALIFCVYCLTLHGWLGELHGKYAGADSWYNVFLGLGLGFLVMLEGVALFALLPRIYAERADSTISKAFYRRGILIPLAHFAVGIIVAKTISDSVTARRLGEYRDLIYWTFLGVVLVKELWLWGYILLREVDDQGDLRQLREKYANDLRPELVFLFDAIIFAHACLVFTFVWNPYTLAYVVADRRGDALEPGFWRILGNSFFFLLYYIPTLLVFVFSDWLTLKSRAGKLWFAGALLVATFGGTWRYNLGPAMPDAAHLNTADASGVVPVVRFARYAPTSRLDTLLAKHPDVNAANTDGTTALMAALASRRLEVFNKLVSAGANVNAQDSKGKTALHNLGDCFLGSIEFIETLKKNGADFGIRDNEGRTPALWSLTRICGNTTETLIEGMRDLDVRDNGGKTLLMHVAARGYTDLTKRIAAKGACINCQDLEGNTALHLALLEKNVNPDYVRLMLQLGANPGIRNKAGQSCIDLASAKSRPKSRRMMLAARGPYKR